MLERYNTKILRLGIEMQYEGLFDLEAINTCIVAFEKECCRVGISTESNSHVVTMLLGEKEMSELRLISSSGTSVSEYLDSLPENEKVIYGIKILEYKAESYIELRNY